MFDSYKPWVNKVLPALLVTGLLTGCLSSEPDSSAQNNTPAPVTPAERPKDAECVGSSVRKQAFFGDLHIHTKLSFDAYFFNSINGPREAYQFAKGENAFLPSGENPDTPMRQINIGRPLDFAAVTEHAEQLGTFSNICELQGNLPAGTNPACSVLGQVIRDNVSVFITGNVPLYLQVVTGAGSLVPSTRTWEEIQAIANEENQPCKFTTFNGYEFSSNKGGQVLHRNVIFAGTRVPADVISSTPLIPTTNNTNDEWNLFDRLKTECLDVDGCDVVTIPHSTNQSDGRFARPRQADTGLPLARNNATLTAADATLRNTLDRLFEIVQHKGASECITGFSKGLTGGEESGCGFEEWKTLCKGAADDPAECAKVCKGSANDPLFCQVNRLQGKGKSIHAVDACTNSDIGGSTPGDCTSPLDYARNVLPEGSVIERKLGVNPYQYGFIGSSDTHNGIAGNTDKTKFAKNSGHGGVLDDEPNEALGNWECRQQPLPTDSITGFKIPFSVESASDPNRCADRVFNPVASNFTPGGLAGVWARENTRKEIFAALKRRETFATSGSRMRIRTLASRTPLPGNICEQLASGRSPIEEGLVDGVPMGGTLNLNGQATGTGPYIVAYAIQDPGGDEAGIPLQRLELIKTWADKAGELKQQVLRLAENAGAPQPNSDCSIQQQGPEQMCAVFHDTQFNADTGASYYARALENNSCRWTTKMCTAKGVQCEALQPGNGLFSAQSGFAGYEGCCRIEGEPGSFRGDFRFITQQERAWSSPIWVEGKTR
ncbi:uncharacterized protein DUF3604 [Limnobacter thiooxidans]|uniref:DUF3604 domain-containing protein n=1 Tax=Limnobacter thiooxidans TaxID=131080 RepID=A0AA86J372_9BURK|nr:uncharacterized protein DUF3604 [Limnobacter thiooxidans]BET26274.1 DUF3604 domain-containing protein [Limnobacter thiooxidans]